MKVRSGILAGGNWIVDKLKVIDCYPQQDALSNILAESSGNGGSPFNVLLDLSKLGARFPLAAIGLVGNDPEGEWVRSECTRHGVAVEQLRTHASAPTSYTDVMTVRSSGRRTFFHQRGANAHLAPEHFDFAASNAKVFHLGYLLLLDALDGPDPEFGTVAARVLCRAVEAGFKTSLDVVSEDSQRFADIVLPALRYVDYCILNELELERTTGVATRRHGAIDLHAIEMASRRLLEAGVREWVVVHFPEGAAALGADREFRLLPSVRMPREQVVGTVGAGDAFAAGVLYGLHEEMPIDVALRYGVTTAAACLTSLTCSDGIVSLANCLKLGTLYGLRGLDFAPM